MALIFRALRSRNYRLFFFGQGLSLIGTWMQRVALGWLVYEMTDSAMFLGLVAFLGQLPVSVVSPVAGALADRMDRRRLLVWTQALEACQATALAVLTFMGIIEVWHIVVLSLFLGTCFAVESPTRQAFVIEMTGPEDLMNAIALNSSLVNSARLLGPALAGFVVAAAGEGVVFAANAISYIAVIVALLAMRLPRREQAVDRESVVSRIRQGVNYAFSAGPIRALLLMLASFTLIGIMYTVLLPVFARDVLGRGPEALGILMGANGAGALAGAILLAMRKNVRGLARVVLLATTVLGAALVGFSFSTNLYLSSALLCVVGMSFIHVVAGTNTLVQTLVSDEMRGRVMSLFILSFLGIMPFGNLLAGSIASQIGAPHTVLLSGTLLIFLSAAFGLRLPRLIEKIHSVQVKRGFVEEQVDKYEL